ncbi:tetratricopeptide repeat protein [Clostridium perfringens]|nr:tetratricopeptide repeat protein [Clostridium perfringens]
MENENNNASIEEQLEVIDILMKYNRLDMALEALFSLKEQDDSIEVAYFKISEIYEEKGLFENAIEEMRKLEIKDNTSGSVKFKLATLYQQIGRLDKTFHYLSQAINNGYDSEKVFFYKGLVYEDKNDFDEAIYLYRQALMKNKSYMAPKYRLYKIYLGLNRLIEAESILNQMIINNSDDYDGYSLKILFKLKLNKFSDTLEVLKLAQERFGESENVKLDFIRYYITLKEYDKALEIINEIDEKNDYYTEFMTAKAKILTIKGEYTKAIEVLTNKDVYDEENQELIYVLTLLRYKNNEFIELINTLEGIENIDVSDDLGIIIEILKAYSYLNINEKNKAESTFRNLEKLLKIQSSSNPYDTNLILYRMIVLIELDEFNKVEVLKDGLIKLDKEKFENVITDIENLKTLRMIRDTEKCDIKVQKEIITSILQ